MTNSNRHLGNTFETELCKILFDNGFWVHNLAQNKAGQPADILASRNGKAYLIDAKVCSKNEFSLKRVEENQTLSMELWERTGNGQGWFALKLTDEIYMVVDLVIKALANTQSKLSEKDIREIGIPVGKWVTKCK